MGSWLMSFSPLHISAPAKINLFLNLLGLRPDGFHNVCFVMQTLDWGDTLELTGETHQPGLTLTCTITKLATSNNLIVHAYRQFYEMTGLPPLAMRVHLVKQIPVQAGLGGGSSDAAAMLQALNHLHQTPLDALSLHHLASRLGSDVPFFLKGGTAIAIGKGEILTHVAPLPPCEIVLLIPRHMRISTPIAYQWVREAGHYQTQPFDAWERLLASPYTTPDMLALMLFNDFETAVFPRFPLLAAAKATLYTMGLPGVLLSGSGSALFGLISKPDIQWEQLAQVFPESDWQYIRTRLGYPHTVIC
jgi:4-diphosphocytidyl-2-C-methyl-D-erythritol kinase